MANTVLIGIVGASLTLVPPPCAAWAGRGGGSVMVRHGAGHSAWGGVSRMGHGDRFPGHGGEARVRFSGGSLGGRGVSYGHVDTAWRGGGIRRFAGAGFERRTGYGHVNTGFGRLRPAARFALVRHRFGYGGYGGDYGYGAGSGDVVSASGSGGAGYGYAAGGEAGHYGAAPAGYSEGYGGGFAEPPLNAVDYGGGPRILVTGRHRTVCSCERDGAPIVYRFGVGSYY